MIKTKTFRISGFGFRVSSFEFLVSIKKFKYFWIGVSLLIACGCGSSGEGPMAPKLALPTMGKTLTPQTALPLATGPSALPAKLEPYYDPTGKPDPFQPPVLEQTQQTKQLLPLEQFEVSEFQLVTTVTGPGEKKAMVQDPSGKGYLIKVGTPIGKKQGRVTAIADRQIQIEEKIKDFLGREKSRKVPMEMPPAR
jgi:type IV pilus assembly protein PilP